MRLALSNDFGSSKTRVLVDVHQSREQIEASNLTATTLKVEMSKQRKHEDPILPGPIPGGILTGILASYAS